MPAYSFDGYLSALRMRNNRTLLVEGRTDKKILSIVASFIRGGSAIGGLMTIVDHVDLIASDNHCDARELIERIHSIVGGSGIPFAGFVDREFRLFVLRPELADGFAMHKVVNGSLFWTRGHSAENYLFFVEAVLRFIRLKYSDQLSVDFEEYIRSSFGQIMLIAAAVSLAALEAGTLKRSLGIAKAKSWIVTGDDLADFDIDSFISGLIRRDAREESLVVFRASYEHFVEQLKLEGDALRRWITHGHLGFELLWSGVGAVVESLRQPQEVVEQLAHGEVDLKYRYMTEVWLDSMARNEEEFPEALFAWLGWSAVPNPA
jgi:hypothetical protein